MHGVWWGKVSWSFRILGGETAIKLDVTHSVKNCVFAECKMCVCVCVCVCVSVCVCVCVHVFGQVQSVCIYTHTISGRQLSTKWCDY